MNIPASGILTITAIEDGDIADVIALWQRCGSTREWNDPAGDIALARKETNATVLVGRNDGAVVASVLVGHDGHRGWLYYLAVAPARQRKGVGRMLVSAAEQWLAARGVPKVQLMVRETNEAVVAFYQRLGFEPMPRINMQKWLKP